MIRPDPEELSFDQLIDEVVALREIIDTMQGADVPIDDFAIERGLTVSEAAILRRLALRPGWIVSKGSIHDSLYGLADPFDAPSVKIIDVYVCKLRQKLAGTGLVVSTHWGRGYSLGGKLSHVGRSPDEIRAGGEAPAAAVDL